MDPFPTPGPRNEYWETIRSPSNCLSSSTEYRKMKKPYKSFKS